MYEKDKQPGQINKPAGDGVASTGSAGLERDPKDCVYEGVVYGDGSLKKQEGVLMSCSGGTWKPRN
jgi:hypothetical protein